MGGAFGVNFRGMTEFLLSLPAGTAGRFHEAEPYRADDVFVTSDPPGSQLGSGGGTAWILDAARRNAGGGPFEDWLAHDRKLIIHGSGQSRRLPAYAAPGKPLVPIPPLRGIAGQRPDQILLDLQSHAYDRLFWHAPETYRLMVTCGDVLLRCDHWLPVFPEADVLIIGLTASAEEAQRHGVMLCPAADPNHLSFFLQKPSAERIAELSATHTYYLDTGVWLFSKRAVMLMMEKCGWDASADSFKGDMPDTYDLYSEFGPALGAEPVRSDPDVSALSCAVLPLADGRFYHFGTNRSVMASVGQLQRPAADLRSFGHASMESTPGPFIQHAEVRCDLTEENRHIWIENATIGPRWQLSSRHVLTGIPDNDWGPTLAPGVCVDFTPVDGMHCVRCYGLDDPFRGPLAAPDTAWFGQPAAAWFQRRGISLETAGLDPAGDIQESALFPVLAAGAMPDDFLAWLCAATPSENADCRRLWLNSPRRSCRELLKDADVVELARQRRGHMERRAAAGAGVSGTAGNTDFLAAAKLYSGEKWPVPESAPPAVPDIAYVHDCMFRSALARHAGDDKAVAAREHDAFDALRRLIVGEMETEPVRPTRNVLEDQIVWGRSPVRLDLAGGWTDTPPYCLEHGGRVVNLAVDLNGQPPIQVFGRICEKPEIVLRSIDLGIDQRVTTYQELTSYAELGSGFAIARAALSLAGLEPRFHADGGYDSLARHLEAEFGGGIELSMVCAIPKGSGLGTSSMLAATLLGTLSELFGLRWDTRDLFRKTMALEQMLTSGGGWQDQAGGILHGLKVIETQASLSQEPVIRWLPGHYFSGECANTQSLLYYTGITRVARDILGEIVRGLFLNSAAHVGIIDEIGHTASFATDAIQRDDWDGLCEAVRRSWCLNNLLDSGTCPPPVQTIVNRITDYAQAFKLLGAGGGGYLVILAKDMDATSRIRADLQANPPNSRARFVDLHLSDTGLQITRS